MPLLVMQETSGHCNWAENIRSSTLNESSRNLDQPFYWAYHTI